MRNPPLGKPALALTYTKAEYLALVALFAKEMGREPSVSDWSFMPVIKMSVLNHTLASLSPHFQRGQKRVSAIRLRRLLEKSRKIGGAHSCDEYQFQNALDALGAEEEDLPRLACLEHDPEELRFIGGSMLMITPLVFPPDCAVIARWRLQLEESR